MEITRKAIKDIGQDRIVSEVLPYAVVGGQWEGSFTTAMPLPTSFRTLLNYIVPHGKQLKMLFMRIWTEDANGALFSIIQTNPTALGQTGTSEAFPVVGSVPSGVRDWPMLEAAGAEVLHGNMMQPIHVFEGSVDFRLYGPVGADADRYGLVWWGVEKDEDITEAQS